MVQENVSAPRRGRLEAIGLNYGLIYTLRRFTFPSASHRPFSLSLSLSLSLCLLFLLALHLLVEAQIVFILSFYRSFSFYRLFSRSISTILLGILFFFPSTLGLLLVCVSLHSEWVNFLFPSVTRGKSWNPSSAQSTLRIVLVPTRECEKMFRRFLLMSSLA